MNSKPFFVLLFFAFLITIFAGGAIGDTDLTPDTPAATNNGLISDALVSVVDGASIGVCGGTYTVHSGDTLSAIARSCSLALADLVAANPQITNANLIRVGQTIKIPMVAAPARGKQAVVQATDVPVVEAPAPTATEVVVEAAAPVVEEILPTSDEIFSAFETARSPLDGSQADAPMPTPRPTVVAKGLKPGSLVQVSVAGFPANTPVSVGIGQVGKEPFFIDESVTDDQGVATVVVAVPADAKSGQKWTVTITTLNSDPPISATAMPFMIGK
jgi:LysM repeat protein